MSSSTSKSSPPSTSLEPEKSINIIAAENEPAPQYLKGLKLAILLGGLTLVTFLCLLDTSIVGVAIPDITTEFHALPDVGWYVGVFSLAAATLQPLSGKLYTYFPNKIVYLSSFLVFELGSLICGVAPSSAAFIAGRAVAGMGVSGMVNGALTILSASVEKEKSPLYLGILLGTSQMGIVAGPLIGGALTEHVTWRWCFYLNLPVGGVAAIIFAFIKFPEATKKEPLSLPLLRKVIPELDPFGFLLFVPSSIMFLLALQFGSGNTYSWKSATVIGLFVGAGLLGSLFILWERRMGDRAMLPGSLFKQRIVITSCVFGLCNVCCSLIASNWMPTYFQTVRGESPTMSGVHVLPSILSQLLVVVVSGAAISKLGYYLPWAFGGGIVTAVGNGLVSTFTPTTTVGRWVGYQIVLGAGRGASMQTALVAIQNAVSSTQIPIAVATLIFLQNFGTAIIMVISNTVFAQTLTKAIHQDAPSVSPQAALDAGSGAGAVRELVIGHEGELDGLLLAYSESLRNIFYLLVGISITAVISSLGMGWVDVRKKNKEGKPTGHTDIDDERTERMESKGLDEA